MNVVTAAEKARIGRGMVNEPLDPWPERGRQDGKLRKQGSEWMRL